MDTTLLIAALSMGFLGSLHCAGMCGPIMLVMPFAELKGGKKALGIGLYHLGRISVYALMGLVLHSFKALFHPEAQQVISVVLGGMLLIAGILTFTSSRFSFRLPWMGAVSRASSRFMAKPGLLSLAGSGVLNGLLPCGLVYMALALAVGAPTPVGSMLAMYAFGIGTIPMLLAIILLRGRVRFLQSANLRRMVPVFMLLFGTLFLLRGLDLGIPYLSPKVTVAQSGEVEADCCHKK